MLVASPSASRLAAMSGLLLIGGMVLLSPLRFAAVRQASMKRQLGRCSTVKGPANDMVPTLFTHVSPCVCTYFYQEPRAPSTGNLVGEAAQ